MKNEEKSADKTIFIEKLVEKYKNCRTVSEIWIIFEFLDFFSHKKQKKTFLHSSNPSP
jgi:hypothetical protein